MPFHRTDDQMHGHPKARRAGLPALGLWVMAGSHSMAYKTDGFVPDWFVSSWPGGKKAADALVREGLWDTAIREPENGESRETGYQFHDWHDYNPTADEIERDRIRARERQRESRRRLREGKTKSQEASR